MTEVLRRKRMLPSTHKISIAAMAEAWLSLSAEGDVLLIMLTVSIFNFILASIARSILHMRTLFRNTHF